MLTFVIATYGQPQMMAKWFENLREYDKDVLSDIHLVIVDDHGNPPVEIPNDIHSLIDLKLFRVTDDIPWNQMGARNLGVQEAPTNWVLMLDPDMVVEPPMAARLLRQVQRMSQGMLMKLQLKYTDDVLDDSSPNVYLVHKKEFERVGGYDEDYAGHKGWSDVQLMHTFRGLGVRFLPSKGFWVRYYRPRDIADATVTTLDRDTKHNRAVHIRKMNVAKKNWKTFVASKGPNIRFKWSRVL